MPNEKVTKTKSGMLMGQGGVTEAGYHSIETFLRCPKEYQFSSTRGIGKPMQYEPSYFTVGRMLHAGKAKWFARGFKTTEKTWQKMKAAMELEAHTGKLPPQRDALRDGLRYMEEYVEHWSKRPLPKPVAAEYKLGPAPFSAGDPFFLFRTARLDDVSYYPEQGGALCIGEMKSTSDSPTAVVDQYDLHGQTMLQFLLWKHAQEGEATHGKVAGTVLDIIKKGYGTQKSTFSRQFIPFSEYALEWFAKTFRANLRAAALTTWDADVPRNITACTRLAGRRRVNCDFKDLCKHGKSASAKFMLKETGSSLMKKEEWKGVCGPWE